MIPASRCPECERTAVPPEERCLACRAETQPAQLAPVGEVLTYVDQDGWIAMVQLEGGARVLARLEEEPTIGEEIDLEAATLVQASE